MIVLDTMVLVYATGLEHPFLQPCRRLVNAITDGRLEATTTPEVIQEFMHVRARRRGRADAAALAKDYADLLAPLLTVSSEHLNRGIDLFRRMGGLDAFDAVLAAAAIDSGASAVVSVDQGFSSLTTLQHVIPDEGGVSGLLAS